MNKIISFDDKTVSLDRLGLELTDMALLNKKITHCLGPNYSMLYCFITTMDIYNKTQWKFYFMFDDNIYYAECHFNSIDFKYKRFEITIFKNEKNNIYMY